MSVLMMRRRSNSPRECTMLLLFDICFNVFGFYFKHKVRLVVISDVTLLVLLYSMFNSIIF